MQQESPEIMILKALGDSTRIRILNLLFKSKEGVIVSTIAGFLQISQPLASHHLSILEEVGLVYSEPEAQYRLYKAKKDPVEKTIKLLGDIILPPQEDVIRN